MSARRSQSYPSDHRTYSSVLRLSPRQTVSVQTVSGRPFLQQQAHPEKLGEQAIVHEYCAGCEIMADVYGEIASCCSVRSTSACNAASVGAVSMKKKTYLYGFISFFFAFQRDNRCCQRKMMSYFSSSCKAYLRAKHCRGKSNACTR